LRAVIRPAGGGSGGRVVKARPVRVYMTALVLAVAIPLCVVLGYVHWSAVQREEAVAIESALQLAPICFSLFGIGIAALGLSHWFGRRLVRD